MSTVLLRKTTDLLSKLQFLPESAARIQENIDQKKFQIQTIYT